MKKVKARSTLSLGDISRAAEKNDGKTTMSNTRKRETHIKGGRKDTNKKTFAVLNVFHAGHLGASTAKWLRRKLYVFGSALKFISVRRQNAGNSNSSADKNILL